MSRISSIVSVSTPVSDRIKIFDKSPVSPKKIPPKSNEKPVRESATLETPKLRPVPRSQFPPREVPASVRPYLNTKLSPTPAKAEQKTEPSAIVKVELKAVKSDKSDKSDSRVATRSSSTAR